MADGTLTNPWRDFEREVASIFRALGATVEHDVAVAGNQVDVIVREKTASGRSVTTIIECKAYQRPVGIEVVNALSGLFHLLKGRGEADVAILVSQAGFSRAAARAYGVELLEIADLRQRVGGRTDAVEAAAREVQAEDEQRTSAARPPRIFVAMPFNREFNDIYLLGIRDVAERLGYVVERAGEIEHNGYIVDVITDHLRSCDLLVADTSTCNPNVFYEVGYGLALSIPTVLICREGEDLPFDVKAINHIVYGSIVDLREKLERRLRSMLDGGGRGARQQRHAPGGLASRARV
jgi:Restriction endonuclease